MKYSVREIAKSATRALGAIYSKFLCAGGMSISVNTMLVETIVEPMLFFAQAYGVIQNLQKSNLSSIKRADVFLALLNIVPMFRQGVTGMEFL